MPALFRVGTAADENETKTLNKLKTYRNIATFSYGIARLPNLAQLLGADHLLARPKDEQARDIDAVVGWGLKPNTENARQYAEKNRLPYLHLEDGFLRSVNLGVDGEPPLSIVVDERGIYYDSSQVSDLEAILSGDDPRSAALDDPALLSRAQSARKKIVEAQLSKYNSSPCDLDFEKDPRFKRHVLVVDQTAGDMSVVKGGLHSGGFQAMLEAALDENPGAQIVVKTHPDVLAGKKKSCLGPIPKHDRLRVLTSPINPIRLLEKVDHVYVATSQLGFEALMVGRPVTCFGIPFYAGWDLTDDRVAVPRRNRCRSLDELFAAAYLLYPRYLDPDTKERCEAERVIEHLALQRGIFEQNKGRIFCFGFSLWKRAFVRSYLRSPGNQVTFARSPRGAKRKGFDSSCRVLVWGQRETRAVADLAAKHRTTISRMEDGFLRSVGLGSDLTAPASLVVDQSGIYYDPTSPSDLENILQRRHFTEEELERAASLRLSILEAKVSKYNLGRTDPLELKNTEQQRVILVPGQVEDDASIDKGCLEVRTNLGLLEAVRKKHPDDYIVFKPHPDVVTGNRRGAVPSSTARAVCDLVVEDASIAQCLESCDSVHSMTSLVGFEALLRGLDVTTYGQPFYSGWGLTNDRHPHKRRTRRLELNELIAGALIVYPRYLSSDTGHFTTAETVVANLAAQSASHKGQRAYRTNKMARRLRKLVHLYKGLTNAS